jgi:hypothetical protein
VRHPLHAGRLRRPVQLIDGVRAQGVADAELPAVLPKRVAAGGFALATSGGPCFGSGQALDPCHGCVQNVARFGLEPQVFASGVEPT